MSVSTAYQIAESIINLSHYRAAPVTNLKLQKLLYYAQAWHLAINNNEPLFSEDFEAWVHGPVIPSIFRTYKSYKWSPIDDVPLTQRVADSHLQEVWRVYGTLKAFELERLTHSEDPWKQAREGLAPDASSNELISKDSIYRYYHARLNGRQTA